MTTTISSFFLTFSDKYTQLLYEREKKIYYSKLMPVISIITLQMAAVLELLKSSDASAHEDITTIVNLSFFVVFVFLAILVRFRHMFSWFICPFITAFAFYYCSVVRLDHENITQEFSVTIIMCASFFLLVFFNEVWLISTAVFGPLIAFTMWQAGKDMDGTKESEELVIRTFVCLITYGVVGFMLERKSKLAFVGQHSAEKALLSFF
jgi:hypothetical protein